MRLAELRRGLPPVDTCRLHVERGLVSYDHFGRLAPDTTRCGPLRRCSARRSAAVGGGCASVRFVPAPGTGSQTLAHQPLLAPVGAHATQQRLAELLPVVEKGCGVGVRLPSRNDARMVACRLRGCTARMVAALGGVPCRQQRHRPQASCILKPLRRDQPSTLLVTRFGSRRSLPFPNPVRSLGSGANRTVSAR